MKTYKTLMGLFLFLVGCQEQGSMSLAPSNPAIEVSPSQPPAREVPGTDVGNGGDHVRSTFFRMGETVLKYLEEEETGKNLVQNSKLNIETLRSTLTIQKVFTIDGELKDNGGSDVDATGMPGKITLKKSSWMEHFEKERDVYYLVFHEMLRSAGVMDDNYIVSKTLLPFPANLKIATRITTLLPLIPEENLSGLITKESIGFAGPGCPTNNSKTYLDFDTEKNNLELTFKGYNVELPENASTSLARTQCAIALPFKAPEGKKLTISQVDMSGTLHLPLGTKAQANIEAFTPATSGEKQTRTFEPKDQDLHGRFQIRSHETFSTACGTSENLRVNTSLKIDGKLGDRTSAKVERITVYLKLENCE